MNGFLISTVLIKPNTHSSVNSSLVACSHTFAQDIESGNNSSTSETQQCITKFGVEKDKCFK